MVILEVQCSTLCAHALESAANLPLVRPDTVTGGITNGIVGEGATIVGGQLILPVGIAIGIRDGFLRSTQRAGGVGMVRLAGEKAEQRQNGKHWSFP